MTTVKTGVFKFLLGLNVPRDIHTPCTVSIVMPLRDGVFPEVSRREGPRTGTDKDLVKELRRSN